MSNPTTPFGWQMPENTDLVTDLPADFEVFGQAVATDLQYLLGGTTGQVLAKGSATDLDFDWVAPTAGDIEGVTAGIGISGGGTSGTVTVTNSMATAFTTSGDLIQATGSGTFARLGTGTNGQYLTTNGTTNSWGTVSAGGMTLISTTTLSGTTTTISSIPSGYVNLFMIVSNPTQAGFGNPTFRINGLSTSIYTNQITTVPSSSDSYSVAQMPFPTNPATTPQTGFYTIDIPNYLSTSTTKNIRISGCMTNQSGTTVDLYTSVNGANTLNAITSFSFAIASGQAYTGGTVQLYGVK